ncbi:MAG TPA: hypothetical protein VHE61_01070, partial [Opitutaceae bacterium]|nr:hypothetical protein [Opitutaceae bacterium]
RRRIAGAVHAWAGDKEGAIMVATELLREPGALKVATLRYSPFWAPMRDDPRIQALIADPKNNAPLF